MLLFGARVTEDVGDLYLHLLHLLLLREITIESSELRIELPLFKKTPCWADLGWWFVSDGRRSWRLACVLTWAVDQEKESIM